jgi:hypothetical protein
MPDESSPSGPNIVSGAKTHLRLRWALAGVSAVVTACVIGYSLYLFYTEASGNGLAPIIRYTDLAKVYFDLKQDQLKGVSQTVLLIFVAVWGLLIAKSGDAKIMACDRPEICMFVCFNAIVIVCLGLIYLCTRRLESAIHTLLARNTEPSVPDYYNTIIGSIGDFTYWLLVAAAGVAAVTFLSVHRLKEGDR